MPTSRQPMKSLPPAMPPRCCRSLASASARCSLDRCTARRESSTGPSRMAREMARCFARTLLISILLAAAGEACGQADVLRRAYAAIEERTQAEFEFKMAGITRQLLGSGAPVARIAPIKAYEDAHLQQGGAVCFLCRRGREGPAA